MDFDKLQVEAFKNIVSRKGRVCYALTTDGRVAVTPEGFTAFAIPERDLCIDIGKMQELPYLADYFTDKPIADTIGTVSQYIYKGKFIKIFSKEDPKKFVYCNKSYYDKYESGLYTPHFTSNREIITFVNDATGLVNHVILPTLVYEKEMERSE